MLRIAIAGVGHLGRFHTEKAIDNPRCEVVALVEPNNARRAEVCERYDVPGVASLEQLGADACDAVILAAPTALHAELGEVALGKGWHLLVEKPMADTAAGGQRLVAAAAAAGRVLQVGMTERFNPAVQAALSIAERPRYMVSERLGPFTARSVDIDVIRDLMIHDLDIMLHLNQRAVTEIRAVGVPLLTDQLDMANVRLAFEDGSVAQLTASRASLAKNRAIRLFTLSQYVSIDCEARTVKSVQRLPAPPGSPFPMIQGQPVEVDTDQDPLAAQLDNFLDAIEGSAAPLVSGVAAMRSLQVAVDIIDVLTVPVLDLA